MIVATNGCFDILHIGHVRLLKYAKSLGDWLIVGLNSDKSIKQIKGNSRPINNQDIRKEILLSLKFIDEVIIFNEPNCVDFLKKIKPQIYVKGGDYDLSKMNQEEYKYLKSIRAEIKFFDYIKGYSTTNIIGLTKPP